MSTARSSGWRRRLAAPFATPRRAIGGLGTAALLGALAAACALGAFSSGCGGKAVVDGAGGEGAGGTTSHGGSGGASCAELSTAYQTAFAEAIACNACLSIEQCYGGPQINDSCGCPAGANATTPDKADDAKAAYQAWTGAGCGPLDCGVPCSAQDTAWFCSPSSGSGCSATCMPGGWL
jgi:hypothetical protein